MEHFASERSGCFPVNRLLGHLHPNILHAYSINVVSNTEENLTLTTQWDRKTVKELSRTSVVVSQSTVLEKSLGIVLTKRSGMVTEIPVRQESLTGRVSSTIPHF